jgi:hypothetical protein
MTVPKDTNPLGLPATIGSMDEFLSVLGSSLDKVIADPALAASIGQSVAGNPINIEVVPTIEKWLKRYTDRTGVAGQDWVDGMQSPSADPKSAALAAKGKWKTSMEAALRDDSYAKGISGYDLDEAIQTAIAVGASGYTSGIAARTGKIRRKIERLQPLVAALKRTLDALPQDTEAQRESKMIAAVKGMREIGKRLRA